MFDPISAKCWYFVIAMQWHLSLADINSLWCIPSFYGVIDRKRSQPNTYIYKYELKDFFLMISRISANCVKPSPFKEFCPINIINIFPLTILIKNLFL